MADLIPSQGPEAKEAQIKASSQENGVEEEVKKPQTESEPTKVVEPKTDQIEWKAGDNCRAKWSEDQVIYESVILDFGEHKGKKFAKVEFHGYGNHTKVWVKNLMPSLGDEAINQQKQAAGQGQPQDECDSSPANATPEWKVGDDCRAIFQDDGLEYEGQIEEITDSDGAKYATIKVGDHTFSNPRLLDGG